MAAILLYEVFTLLRHICEISPRKQSKQTKGGYLQGKIKIPRVKGKLKMEIQTVPADDVDPDIADIHPCLVHVVRLGGQKGRQQHLEPTPSKLHWKQIFEIEDGKVKILNRLSDRDTTPETVPDVDEVTKVHGKSINLGGEKGMLHLILLQPNQKQSKESDATIFSVIENRLNPASREYIKQRGEKFIKKPINLKRICLKVDFYTENGKKCGSAFSSVIIDSKDKDVGIMKFYDGTPLISCVNGGRKIMMISEFELAYDVVPVFQVYDSNGFHRPDMDQYLTQPREFKRKNLSIIFITPPQKNFSNIQKHFDSFKIKLVGKRQWDGYTGGSCCRDDKALSSSNELKGKIAIGAIINPEKISGIKTESGWNLITDFAENFVLENIPFLSFCFVIFILLYQAAAEVAQEWEFDCLLFIPVLFAGFVLYINRKTIYIH